MANKHSDERPFKCDEYDYSAKTKGRFKEHKLIHSGIKPYSCDVCEYKAAHRYALKNHMANKHSNKPPERPFNCDECDYSCKTSSHLRNHKLSHSGIKIHHLFQVYRLSYFSER